MLEKNLKLTIRDEDILEMERIEARDNLTDDELFSYLCVAPRAGAWIETSLTPPILIPLAVAPRAGAWIETVKKAKQRCLACRAPRGRVD